MLTIMCVILGIMSLMACFGYYLENKTWNKGVCVRCSNPWKHFDTDSQGGRGYSCKEGHTTWVSYPIDKGYK